MSGTDWRATLDAFRTLERDWDSYGGRPITETAIAAARDLITAVGAAPYFVAPEAGGGVVVTWQRDADEIEAWIAADGALSYLVTRQSPTTGELFTHDVAAAAREAVIEWAQAVQAGRVSWWDGGLGPAIHAGVNLAQQPALAQGERA